MMATMYEPLHPGEIVKDALFNETGIRTVSEAATLLKVSRITLSRLLNGHAGISSEMAYRLSLLLPPSAEMWLNIERDYELWQVRKKFKNLKITKLAA